MDMKCLLEPTTENQEDYLLLCDLNKGPAENYSDIFVREPMNCSENESLSFIEF